VSILGFFVLGFTFLSIAQDVNSKLLIKYSKSELQQMKKQNKFEYDLLVYSLDHAMYITNYSEEKGENDGVVDMPDENLTYLELGYNLNEIENQFYKIKNTNKGLMILSRKALELQMKSSLNKK
jgi:hypothetical protein